MSIYNSMFNAYLSDKITNKAQVLDSQQRKHLKSISAQIKLRDRLVKRNKIRTEKRVIEMSSDPVPIHRHEYSVKFPEFKGECFFRHRPKDSKERVKDAEFTNTWLDTIPLLPTPHNFRPRIKDKEINQDMKFTPRDRYERVADAWINQQGIINSSWAVNSKQTSGRTTERFPNTLRKSYYKTVESLALDIEPSNKILVLPLVKAKAFEKESVEEGSTSRTLSQLAKEVMEKCKLKPLKSEIASIYASRSASLPRENLKTN